MHRVFGNSAVIGSSLRSVALRAPLSESLPLSTESILDGRKTIGASFYNIEKINLREHNHVEHIDVKTVFTSDKRTARHPVNE